MDPNSHLLMVTVTVTVLLLMSRRDNETVAVTVTITVTVTVSATVTVTMTVTRTMTATWTVTLPVTSTELSRTREVTSTIEFQNSKADSESAPRAAGIRRLLGTELACQNGDHRLSRLPLLIMIEIVTVGARRRCKPVSLGAGAPRS